jgi:hypothetical protein
MQLGDFSTGNNSEPYDVAAINRAYAKSVDWDGMSPLSLNDMPEPWASLKAQAQRLNTEAHQAFMARRRGPIGTTEWELRGSDE